MGRERARRGGRMVLFFTCSDARFVIYMGADKHENEHLIQWGLPTDLWFHVDNLSSAHVYLRLPDAAMGMDDIPPDVLEECCQLVKANSISGCKLADVGIVYTPWENLKKTADMEVGQVGFHSGKKVKKRRVTKNKDIVKRLERTREERIVNHREEREAYDAEVRRQERELRRQERERKEEEKRERARLKELKSYSTLMVEDDMVSNRDHGKSFEEYEDDFM